MRVLKIFATLVLPLDVTTPRDSFCLFALNYRELANSLLTLYVTGLKVVSNMGPFNQGSNDLTTRPSPPLHHVPQLLPCTVLLLPFVTYMIEALKGVFLFGSKAKEPKKVLEGNWCWELCRMKTEFSEFILISLTGF